MKSDLILTEDLDLSVSVRFQVSEWLCIISLLDDFSRGFWPCLTEKKHFVYSNISQNLFNHICRFVSKQHKKELKKNEKK